MNKIEAGGPAFPAEVGLPSDELMVQTGNAQWLHPGMTLRDYFAAKAMQTMCEELSRYDQFKSVANDAYKMADAMLEARK